MAKNTKPAADYAPPHTMTGQKVTAEGLIKNKSGAACMSEMNISVGNISKGTYSPINPYGTGTMRGYGAATKGRKISGKQG